MSIMEVPVLIVGGGPSGLLQAYLLSKLGVECLIIERYPKRLAAPKAHALSPRTLEIVRQTGLNANKVRRIGTPRDQAFWVNFITNLSGEQVGRLPYERMDAGVLEATPEMIHNIPQPDFEDYITSHIEDRVKIIKNASFVSCREDENSVWTTVEDRNTGATFQVHSRYVVACDGSKSRVRKHLGIESDGEESYETMMTIHFNADLRPVVGDRVGMLHWVMDPAVSGFIIAYDLSGNQVLICNFDPQKHPAESWTTDLCRHTVEAAIGQNIPFDILSFRPWILSRQVAQSYQSGRIILAGDAAHSFPPTGGLGLNSGLADVHNLAYKLAGVLQGWADPSLLRSYTHERRHVAEVNSLQSVKNGKKIFSLLKTLGTTDANVEQARLNLTTSIHDPTKRPQINQEIREQQEHFDNLELHIGYVYGSDKIPPNASNFTPKFVTGGRIPHAWIRPCATLLESMPEPVDLSYVEELSESDRCGRRYSTLDLCRFDTFTLLVGPSASAHLHEEVHALLGQKKVPLSVVQIGKDFEFENGSDAWLQNTGLAAGGAVLVRPDQHILRLFDTTYGAQDVAPVLGLHLGLRLPFLTPPSEQA
ncbi:3-propionate hydroxylase [Myriangium duriaei CBS 260.36]|uniref:3-propionate hydroxylase n=1 Tax=Myriangium duriaei CBS 260.36 TaxID=1168546 RepID=A0A9P4IXZ7_9PEZI|nr:3-propionate hydroxylase [Myriangium duriaei CBS 260.36]